MAKTTLRMRDEGNGIFSAEPGSYEAQPCPFCGSNDMLELANTHTAHFWVECGACEAQGPGVGNGGHPSLAGYRRAAVGALAAWNTRPASAD